LRRAGGRRRRLITVSGGASQGTERFAVRGKFIYRGEEKFFLKGATYGTFAPNADGDPYPSPDVVARDFDEMRRRGLNSVRTYTPPPRWLLDLAAQRDLAVLVGFAWEEHVAFLSDGDRARSIERRLRAAVRNCAGHPGVLGYTIGNEIPTGVVRWHGARRVQRFLERLSLAAREEDPNGLITYVNYPPTEYLDLPFADFFCFNVYLESQPALASYLARLHNLAGNRPLVMAEIGLDSRRHGSDAQARVLDWQVHATFASGCAGAFVFAWTDDWYVSYLSDVGLASGGERIEDWDFGLTDRERRPKPALGRVADAFAEAPVPRSERWPRMSVVVCSYNGARTLGECLRGLGRLDYPDYEVIVIDDGSTDATSRVAVEHGVRLIRTENRGLSRARNTGMEAATGEIVVYLDDDAYPDRDWLTYLAATFASTGHAAVGGPNLPPPADRAVVAGLAHAPGSPAEVLISDTEAEHLPGCNLAVRKEALETIGGFDPRFRVAGDDVDVCWRLRDGGFTLGFNPAAMVWHHRRKDLRAYLRQQWGYGRAEALLALKWPSRYNVGGHATWRGRVYGGSVLSTLRRGRPAYGTWGALLFQQLYEPSPGLVSTLPLMPEWYLLMAAIALLSAGALLWAPLLAAAGIFAVMLCCSVLHAVLNASRVRLDPRTRASRVWIRAILALTFALHPLGRLRGRLSVGLRPVPESAVKPYWVPVPRTRAIWCERWSARHDRLLAVERRLAEHGAASTRGGMHDRWDLAVRGGLLGAALIRTLVEEHGGGRQMVRARLSPRWSPVALALVAAMGLMATGAAYGRNWSAAALLAAIGALVVGRMMQESALAIAVAVEAVEQAMETVKPFALAQPGAVVPDAEPA
jgi:GT2 family glycosyltransferase